MSLYHGILNVPLSKRGNIDRQIDAYKAQQARANREAAKAQAQTMKALRAQAKAAVAALSTEVIARIAVKGGITAAQVRSNLKSDAHWNPEKVLRAFALSPTPPDPSAASLPAAGGVFSSEVTP